MFSRNPHLSVLGFSYYVSNYWGQIYVEGCWSGIAGTNPTAPHFLALRENSSEMTHSRKQRVVERTIERADRMWLKIASDRYQ